MPRLHLALEGVAGRGDKWGEGGWIWVGRGAKHGALSAASMLRFDMKCERRDPAWTVGGGVNQFHCFRSSIHLI